MTQRDDRERAQHALIDETEEILEDLDVDRIAEPGLRAFLTATHSRAAISRFGTKAEARMAASVASAAQ